MDDKFFLAMVDKFNSSNIVEMDFNDGSVHLLLRKDGAGLQPQVSSGAVSAPAVKSPQDEKVHLGISAGGGETIKSPIVATFYASPTPDAPPFVNVGSKIKAGQTICILEAMKMMNHLEAEFDCEILQINAKSGELVEYGQELFTVKRS